MTKRRNDSTAGFARAALRSFALALLLTLATTFHAAVDVQSDPPHKKSAFVVSISEARVDNKHGVTSTDCLLVSADGRFRLERRQQALPSPNATLSIFESLLDSAQLERIQAIVDHGEISTLPEYSAPPVSMDVPWFSSVAVRIGSGDSGRKVGYWTWQEGTTGPPVVAAEVKKRWRDSEAALRSLLEWFHGIEGMKLLPSEASPTQCAADEP